MRSSRFKPGDEIVIVNAYGEEVYQNGSYGKIREWRTSYDAWKVDFYDEGENWLVYESEMELAEIVASPLYKALA